MPLLPVASWFPKCLTQALAAIAPACVPILMTTTGTVVWPVAAGVACFGAVVWLTRYEGRKQSEETNVQLQAYFEEIFSCEASSREEIIDAINFFADKLPAELPLDQEATDRLVTLTQAVHQIRDKPTIDTEELKSILQPLLAGHVQTQALVAKSLLVACDRFNGVDIALADLSEDLAFATQSLRACLTTLIPAESGGA